MPGPRTRTLDLSPPLTRLNRRMTPLKGLDHVGNARLYRPSRPQVSIIWGWGPSSFLADERIFGNGLSSTCARDWIRCGCQREWDKSFREQL